MDEKKLIDAAFQGMKNAFIPDPNGPRYGAAVLTSKGNIYSSGQYFSEGLSLTLHSEQAVLAHAASHGDGEIVALVATGTGSTKENPVYPCHMCKQLLWESYLRSNVDMDVIIVSEKGEIIERIKLPDMINYPWPRK